MRRGSNLPAIGTYNRRVVLDAVRRADGLSRTEIAALTGLTAQTVGKVSRQLLDEGLLAETGVVVNGPGKPRTTLALRAPGRLAVGVAIDPAVLTVVLLDLRGAVVARSQGQTPPSTRPTEVVDEIARRVEELVRSAGVDTSHLLGLGLASPGPVDLAAGVVLDPPGLPGWHVVPLREALSAATGLPVLLEKDVTAAAVAELWVRPGDRPRNFAFLYYGSGFGAGLVLHDEVLRGVGSNGGNVGHLQVDVSGPTCGCGVRGCLGALVNPRALVAEAVAAGALDPSAGPVDETTGVDAVGSLFSQLAARARDGEELAVAVVDRAAHRLARAVVLLVNLLDVDEVVVGGPFWEPLSGRVLAVLPGAVASSRALISTHPVRFRSCEVGADTPAVGAACRVLDDALSPRASSLLIGG